MPTKKSPPTPPSPSHPLVVLTTRITPEERDQVRAAAGWGGLQRFVHDAVMAAVERSRKTSR